MQESSSNMDTTYRDSVQSYDRYEVHPSTQLRGNQYNQSPSQTFQATGSDFDSKLDQNLHQMCGKISRYGI